MQQDVKINRNEFIGGSDIPAILGISPFTTRFELARQKAGIYTSSFQGNVYTEYGAFMEGYIRDFVADKFGTIFFEGVHYDYDTFDIPCRCHTDGENNTEVLEIKTTSQVHENLSDYKAYLVQLLFYMWISKKEYGILAVYSRPEDMSTEFDETRLQLFKVNIKTYSEELAYILNEVTKFVTDVKKLKENPFLNDLELKPMDIVQATESALMLEAELAHMKDLERQLKDTKLHLKQLMEQHHIKKFETPNGCKLTLVEDTADTIETVTVFNEAEFASSHPKLFKKFSHQEEKIKKGRSGYVKITVPKKEE